MNGSRSGRNRLPRFRNRPHRGLNRSRGGPNRPPHGRNRLPRRGNRSGSGTNRSSCFRNRSRRGRNRSRSFRNRSRRGRNRSRSSGIRRILGGNRPWSATVQPFVSHERLDGSYGHARKDRSRLRRNPYPNSIGADLCLRRFSSGTPLAILPPCRDQHPAPCPKRGTGPRLRGPGGALFRLGQSFRGDALAPGMSRTEDTMNRIGAWTTGEGG